MELGVVLQCNPPASRVVDLARQAENLGFGYVWTFDSHLLWEEPFVIYSQILAETRKVTGRPDGHQPRHPGLDGHGVAVRDAERDVRQPHGLRDRARVTPRCACSTASPRRWPRLRDSIHVIRELANGREVEHQGSHLRFPWGTESRLPVWVAAYGPKALKLAGEVGDGFILQLADPSIAAWTIAAVREAAEAAGRDPDAITICVAAPAYVGSDLEHMRDQCRWFGGMVGNHVADIVARYGDDGSVPVALTDYIKGRKGYDYNQHGRAGNSHADFVPDEIVDRFCLLGTPEQHIERLEELKSLGVDQFAVYLQHDGKAQTLEAYGETIIPAVRDHVTAKS